MLQDGTEDEFLLNLLADGAYDGIDLEAELSAYQRWNEDKGRVATRSGFVRWLEKAEAPLRAGKKEKPPEINIYQIPPGDWRPTAYQICGPEYGDILAIVGVDDEFDKKLEQRAWDIVRPAFGRRIWLAVIASQKAKPT